MDIIVATLNDLDNLVDLYGEVGDYGWRYHTEFYWRRGVYPTKEDIESVVKAGDLNMVVEDGVIMGSFVLNRECSDDYKKGAWRVDCSWDQVSIIHMLATRPSCRKLEVAKKMVSEAIAMSRARGDKAIRLDTVMAVYNNRKKGHQNN